MIRRILYGIRDRVKTSANLKANAKRAHRCLEIGPGPEPVEGFETLNLHGFGDADYVADATKPLPFEDDTFEVVYASHIIEHVAWYQLKDVVKEWVRILKPGGRLDIWTPDGLKICKAFVEAELEGGERFKEDGWWKNNEGQDPCLWANGRVFTFGDGTGTTQSSNWHRALFSPRFLRELLEATGLEDVREMDRSEVRTYDHGWINLGMTGVKPGGEKGQDNGKGD